MMIKKVISNKNTLKSLKPKNLNEENIPYMQFFKSDNNFIITQDQKYYSATETAKTKDFPFFNQRKLCPSMFLNPNESLENRFNCKSLEPTELLKLYFKSIPDEATN